MVVKFGSVKNGNVLAGRKKKKSVLEGEAVSVSLNTAPTLFLRTYYDAASDCFVDYCWDPQV